MKRVRTKVKVLLNNEECGSFLHGYQEGDQLREVVSMDMYLPTDAELARQETQNVLNLCFRELNVDDPKATWAILYRKDRNRSMSVGDVVVVGETAYACERVGWKQVSVMGSQVTQ